MDNQAFELHPENDPRSWKGRERPQRQDAGGGRSFLLKLFLVSVVAGLLTTALGVVALSLIYTNAGAGVAKESGAPDDAAPDDAVPDDAAPAPDDKFQFLYHVGRSKPDVYPGGEILWAAPRPASDFSAADAAEFAAGLRRRSSKMSLAVLRIRPGALRVPHWHFNADEHGYVLQGTAWIGVVDAGDVTGNVTVVTYNVTAGHAVFFPRNAVHWLKNVGAGDCVVVLFFGTHEELRTLDADDAFFATPREVAARALQPRGGVDFIGTFRKQLEDQAINLPPKLGELVHGADYGRSEDDQVWRYFYDLGGSPEFPFPGGFFRWARYRPARTWRRRSDLVYSESLHRHSDALTLATLTIFANELGQPHFHFNANELGYVVSGCGRAGLVNEGGKAVEFAVDVGDVFFFPVGTQHFLESRCDRDLVLVLAYSTATELETLRMKQYFVATADHILAQLFHKDQAEFQRFPRGP